MNDSQIFKIIVDTLINNEFVKNVSDLAAKMPYDQGYLSKLYNNRDQKKLNLKIKTLLIEKFNINKNFMSKGIGEVFNENESNVLIATQNSRQNLIIVPIKAFGGFLSGYEKKGFIDSLEKSSFPFVKGECFAFEVDGYSMTPDYPSGSYVVASILEQFEWMQKGKEYVLQTIDGIILKRFLKIEDNKCFLESINNEYNPVKPISLKNIKKVYFIEYKINKP